MKGNMTKKTTKAKKNSGHVLIERHFELIANADYAVGKRAKLNKVNPETARFLHNSWFRFKDANVKGRSVFSTWECQLGQDSVEIEVSNADPLHEIVRRIAAMSYDTGCTRMSKNVLTSLARTLGLRTRITID